MTQAETKEFPVHWDNPADAALTWHFDPMHAPVTVTPLGFDLFMEPFIGGFGMMRLCLQNYYMFMQAPTGGPPPGTLPDPQAIIAGGRRWREDLLPEVQEMDRHYRETDFDAMSDRGLASEVDNLMKVRRRCGQLHTMSTLPWWMGMSLLIETCRELNVGDDLAALRLVQGHGSKSVDAGIAMWRVARTAGSIPAVKERLLAAKDDVSADELLASLEGEPEARPFLDQFQKFLEEYGWRSGLFEFAEPTWAEIPDIPLNQLCTYMQMPEYDPIEEQRKLVEERDLSLKKALHSVDPAKQQRLQAVVDAAAQVVSLLEDHNYYIDQRVGLLPRRLVLAAGRRLVDKGLLSAAEDVFYLRINELRGALNDVADDLSAICETRRKEMAHWSAQEPPPHVGAPPPPGPEGETDRFWGSPVLRSDRPDELRGNPASAGVASGPARVIATLDEAHRLKPGDILVTRTTMPPWTPLFAIASAVVTETGGILSHAAVTAREYRLPAVLNVPNATRLIRDGQALEVDGSTGLVRILT